MIYHISQIQIFKIKETNDQSLRLKRNSLLFKNSEFKSILRKMKKIL